MRNPKLKMDDFESRPGGVLALSRGGVQRQRQGGHARWILTVMETAEGLGLDGDLLRTHVHPPHGPTGPIAYPQGYLWKQEKLGPHEICCDTCPWWLKSKMAAKHSIWPS